MIRLSANLSKKIPLPGIQFSSSQCGAALEIEVSDTDKPEAIQARIRELYSLLSSAIDEQIGVASTQVTLPVTEPVKSNFSTNSNGHALPPPQVTQPVQPRAPYTNGRNRLPAANGNGRGIGATAAQQKAVWAICKNLGIEVTDALSEIGLGDLQTLSVKQCSQLIDSLKSRQNGVH